MDGRLYLSKQTHKIYQENCVEGKLFSQFTDMFFWCVILGYQHSPNVLPPGINKGGTFFWTAFDDDIQKPILKMICVKATGNFNILSPDPKTKGYEHFRDILERYAELGFTVLNTRLGGNYSKDNMDKLMELLIEVSELNLR